MNLKSLDNMPRLLIEAELRPVSGQSLSADRIRGSGSG